MYITFVWGRSRAVKQEINLHSRIEVVVKILHAVRDILLKRCNNGSAVFVECHYNDIIMTVLHKQRTAPVHNVSSVCQTIQTVYTD